MQAADCNKNAACVLHNIIHIVHVFYPNGKIDILIVMFYYCVHVFYYLSLRPTSSKWHLVVEAQAMCPCQESIVARGGVECGIGPYSLITLTDEDSYFVVCGVFLRWTWWAYTWF